jgi:hypothetical protein
LKAERRPQKGRRFFFPPCHAGPARGFYDRGNFDRTAEYGVAIENGVAKLTGGHSLHQRLVRLG